MVVAIIENKVRTTRKEKIQLLAASQKAMILQDSRGRTEYSSVAMQTYEAQHEIKLFTTEMPLICLARSSTLRTNEHNSDAVLSNKCCFVSVSI